MYSIFIFFNIGFKAKLITRQKEDKKCGIIRNTLGLCPWFWARAPKTLRISLLIGFMFCYF